MSDYEILTFDFQVWLEAREGAIGREQEEVAGRERQVSMRERDLDERERTHEERQRSLNSVHF